MMRSTSVWLIYNIAGYLATYLVQVNNCQIVFMSNNGSGYSGNTKELFLHMSSNEDRVEAVWVSTDIEVVEKVESEGHNSQYAWNIKGFRTLLTSSVFLLTHGNKFWGFCRNSTVVQTWHGTGPKNVGLTKEKIGTIERIYVKYISSTWDYFVVSGAGKPVAKYVDAFSLKDDNFIVSGYPQNDLLIQPTVSKKCLREKLPTEEEPILVYAPTLREWDLENKRVKFQLDSLDVELNNMDLNLLVNFHPQTSNVEMDDYTNIELIPNDMNLYEILPFADVFITDYSSIYTDYCLLDGEIIHFAFDLEEFRRKRGFYWDIMEVSAGPVVHTPGELTSSIKYKLEGDEKREEAQGQVSGSGILKTRESFHKYHDPNSTQRLCDTVMNNIIK